MTKSAAILKMGLVLVLVAGLSACSPLVRNHGFAPTEEELSEIAVGVDTRDTVATVIGSPSSSGVIRDTAWYYLASRWETRLYFAPEEVDRQLVAVSFDNEGVVTNIERFTLADGQVVVLNRRVTDDNIKGLTFIRQLLGSIGNFNPAESFGNRL